MNWSDLKDKGFAIFGGAVSGGLDSCTVTHWLSEKGIDVKCFTVDLGQPDEEELSSVADRMRTEHTRIRAESQLVTVDFECFKSQL